MCSRLRGGGGRIEDPESWDPRGHGMSYRGFGAGETSREWTGLTCAHEAAVMLGFLSWFSASKSLLGLADSRQDHHIPKPSALQSDQGPPPLSQLTASFPYFTMTSAVLFSGREEASRRDSSYLLPPHPHSVWPYTVISLLPKLASALCRGQSNP